MTVPDVAFQSNDYARTAIESAGLVPVFKANGNAYDPYCQVTKQSPTGYSTAHEGDTVTLWTNDMCV